MSEFKVPVKSWLDSELYRPLLQLAHARGIDEVGQLLEQLGREALEGARKRATPRRGWVKVTPEMEAEIARLFHLHRSVAVIAERVGISPASVYNHLPKEDS